MRVKLILFWTKFWGEYFMDYREGAGTFSKCEISACELTSNRSLLEQADAVVFHILRTDLNLNDLPTVRLPHQRYIFLLLESPAHTRMDLTSLQSFFNWTFTYRLDSDIYWPYAVVPALTYDSQRNYLENKTKMAAWFVSHCSTESGREKVVAELQRYMDVDVYGDCPALASQPCATRKPLRCVNDSILHQYKFYLALENSLCLDYITEKFFWHLGKDVVPVVLSGGNFSPIAPESSMIDVRSFEYVSDLAHHLLRVSSDRRLYNSYFSWRGSYPGYPTGEHGYCQLCRKLNNRSEPARTYPNITDWWYNHTCFTQAWRLRRPWLHQQVNTVALDTHNINTIYFWLWPGLILTTLLIRKFRQTLTRS